MKEKTRLEQTKQNAASIDCWLFAKASVAQQILSARQSMGLDVRPVGNLRQDSR